MLGKLNEKISDTRIRTNELPIRMNSDWLVMLTNEENNPMFVIYKLEDVRNPSVDVIEPTIKLKVISCGESRDLGAANQTKFRYSCPAWTCFTSSWTKLK